MQTAKPVRLILLLLATPAFAQQTDTAVFRVGEIVVQAARPVTTTGGAAALQLHIDSVRTAAAASLEQLMRTMPLVQVRTNSRGEAQFSLRGSGSDAREVAVLVDGMPLSLGWDDRADLSVIPTTAVNTLTLARGLPSLLYGPNVLGGVVEIGVSRGVSRSLNPRGLRAEAGLDHTGAHAFASAVTLPYDAGRNELLVRAGAGYRSRAGVTLPDGIAEPLPGASPDRRANTDFTQRDAFLAARLQTQNGAWTSLTASGYSAQRGIPAELHIQGARFWRYPATRRALAVVAGGTGERRSFLGGIADVEASLGIDAGRTEIDQYDTRAYDSIVANEQGDDRNVTLRVRADQTINGNAALHSALTYADIRHDEVLTPGAAALYRQRLWSAATELSLNTTGNHTRLSMGAAYDRADTPESGDKPPLGRLDALGLRAGVTSVQAGGSVLLHAGVSRRARFPALRELYSGALGRFEPNPELAPERLAAAEAGATLRAGRAQLQAVAFRHVLSNAIVRISTPAKKFKRVNRDRQSSTGLELIGMTAFRATQVSASLTTQHTTLRDKDAGQESEAEYQPGLLASLGATTILPWRVRIDARARYTGTQSCVNAETNARETLPDAKSLDLELSRAWGMRHTWVSQAEIAAAVDNTADAAIYDQCGLPQPGRTFRLQLRLR